MRHFYGASTNLYERFIMSFYDFFSLLGGVGLFLFGVSMMSTGLKNAAGDQLKKFSK